MPILRVRTSSLSDAVCCVQYKTAMYDTNNSRIIFTDANTATENGDYQEYVKISWKWVYLGDAPHRVVGMGEKVIRERKYPGGPIVTLCENGFSMRVQQRYVFSTKAEMMICMLTGGR